MARVASHSGDFRRRLILERRADSGDALVGGGESWDEVAAVWASLRLLRGARVDRGDRAALDNVWAILMRWRDDIDGDCRLRDGARVPAIVARGDPDGRRQWLAVTAREESP